MGLVRAETGVDAGAVVHCGDPAREQRDLDAGAGWVDLSHRGVFTVAGPDRLSWLHAMTTQHLVTLAPHQGTTALLLDAQGHIDHALFLVDDGEVLWGHTEPGRVGDLVGFLDRMRFLSRVEVTDRSAEVAVVWTVEDPAGFPTPLVTRRADDSLGGTDLFLPRTALTALDDRPRRAGLWAYEARRIAAGVARIGLDTDARTIPNEIGVLGGAVHMDKGCYTGQETVARVWNLGRPPRRLVRLQLDGSADRLPGHGEEIALRDAPERPIGVIGSSARHHEQGPIALALVKRTVPVDAPLVVGDVAAGQEVLVDPEVGLHVRPGRS
ncbi:folate-binding protein [Raineyella sp. LH-20]|uniref:CAF17-like 4Fe-4S cluster assembly/insertion protein YgfZ n=1 Tax=Raineyella sp. LH-20 TaxID=3081204 RepID=UPI002952D5AF|nr:folate-binding protein [Raineyella sp. LH-20]WOP17296.1 folate-binding protein [Raineyella sp. LH-20]